MKKKTTRTKSAAKQLRKPDDKLPFIEHINELKRRLLYVAVSVFVFGSAAYGVQQHIVGFLLRPSHGQHLIYTSPGGGLDFLFRVCIYTGIIFSMPVIIYQLLKYLEPLLGPDHVRFALKGSAVSAVLAAAGMAFGYYAGLPAALHFLFNQFTTAQIQPLITIQSYMGFVSMYMFGAALLFQVPLLMIFINRIKPLKPSGLFKYERWMILCSFILAFIMNPTPNVVDQLLLAGPMILMYQVGIGIIAVINRASKPSKKTSQLLARDAQLRAERQTRLASAKLLWQEAADVADNPADVQRIVQDSLASASANTAVITKAPTAATHTAPAVATYSAEAPALPLTRSSVRGQQYINDFKVIRRSAVRPTSRSMTSAS